MTLTSLGIEPDVERVYLAMVDRPDAGVEELAVALDEDKATIRAALDRLADVSLIVAGEGPAGVVPIDPEIGLAALLARKQSELAQHQQEMEESRLAIAQLLASHGGRKSGVDPGVERLSGSFTVRERIAKLAAGCREEALSLSRTGKMTKPAIAAAKRADEEALRRGIRMRSVFLDSVRNDESTMDYLRWLIELGAEIRTLPSLPLRMLVVDRTHAVIPISKLRCGAGALVMTGEVIVHALTALFGSLWKEAEPLGSRRARKEGELSLQEKHVLRLWARGHTDSSAASRMEVSVRTVRRLSDNLSERLGAQSRFQLGALAIAQGWIDPDDLM